MTDYQYVGKSVTLKDARAKVTGAAIYCSDLWRPGMLIGKILYSDRPHANIVSIDTSQAEALPGVKAVGIGFIGDDDP